MPGVINTKLSKIPSNPTEPKRETLKKYVSDDNHTITFRHWRVLHAVYDYGGLTEAAAHLHVTPPTVSYSIQSLEKLLGVKLYHIEGRKIVFTIAGAMLVQQSRNLLRNAIALETGEVVPAVHAPASIPKCTPHKDH